MAIAGDTRRAVSLQRAGPLRTPRPMEDERPLHPHRRFSALTRRILFLNAFMLFLVMGGVLWVQSNRSGLVEERISGILDQALIVAGALAEYTADADRRAIEPGQAEPLLRQLIAPTRLRARVYSAFGRLQIDTRNLIARNVIATTELPPPKSSNPFLSFVRQTAAGAQRVYDGLMGSRPLTRLENYFEAGANGRLYAELNNALLGNNSWRVRATDQGSLVISVAVPIRRFGTIYGALLLSTEAGDIDDILKGERSTLLEVFGVAFLVLLFSALYLARFIAEPIRRLARAAEMVREGRGGREVIPRLPDRGDEIGELANSFSAMTRALYDRIDGIERFAADVAHELKNPLTSLKSALDTLERTKTPADRERLLAVIMNDLTRIDRLITDISDASRLDAELSRGESNPVDLVRLLETLVTIYGGMDLPRGVGVEFSRGPPGGAIVQGLDERLGQVFRNLIDNAISFSPDNGTVRVSAQILGTYVRTAVEDEGPGIPDGDLERIFNRFYTERPADHGFGKNSGLGLAIARQIVISHGGRIWAENRFDAKGDRKGARFVADLPLSMPPARARFALTGPTRTEPQI